MSFLAPSRSVMDEITDFLAAQPDPEAILAFRLPAELEQRALDLLDRNREGTLTSDEQAEIQDFLRMNHFMNMLKLKTRLHLAGQA